MSDRIEQAAREILRKQFRHAFPNTDDINSGASSIAALIRREREDAIASVAHQPCVRDGVPVCARCGVDLPQRSFEACCRALFPVLPARGPQ
jgi:hypothetical protein